MRRAARRTLLSAALFGALFFGEIETQAAGDLWAYRSCVNWLRYRNLDPVQNLPTPVGRFGRCSSERMRMACRVAVTGAPVQGLKMCPDELCPTIGTSVNRTGRGRHASGPAAYSLQTVPAAMVI